VREFCFGDTLAQLAKQDTTLRNALQTQAEATNLAEQTAIAGAFGIRLTSARPAVGAASATTVEILQGRRCSMVLSVGVTARSHYLRDDFGSKDMRRDTSELWAKRLNLLACMTRPDTLPVLEARTEQIAGFLGRVVAGKRITVEPFVEDNGFYGASCVAADPDRPVFAALRVHTLHIQYGPQNTLGTDVAEPILSVPLLRMFTGTEGVVLDLDNLAPDELGEYACGGYTRRQ
jgi:hypothetical protein